MNDTAVARREAPATWHLAFMVLAFYFALSAVKMRAYVFSGRFWAEEGKYYFANIKPMGFIDGLAYQYNGHLEWTTNLVVALGALVPFRYAPLATTYLSFALQTLPILFAIRYHRRLGLTPWTLLGFVLILVGLPEAAEVWANAINLHFHFALLAALIAAIEPEGPTETWGFAALLVVCGLSGIPANFLVPIFLVLAWRSGSAARWMQCLALAATSALQIGLLLSHDLNAGQRDIHANPLNYWLGMLSHQLLAPSLGYRVGDRLSLFLREVLNGHAGATAFALVCTLPFVAWAVHAARTRDRTLKALFCSAMLLMLLSVLSSLGDRSQLVSASTGGRYYYVPNALLAIYLLSTLGRSKLPWGPLFCVLLMLSALTRVRHYWDGQDWRVEYQKAMDKQSAQIEIWPDRAWSVPNFDLNVRP